jgi:CDP-6-deoxy-D-xylo-4-hexulose-3-dehydrase
MIRFAIVRNKMIKALVRREMKSNLRELNAKRKFFYPLAEPTYSEREVFSALSSMTSYSTTMWDKVKEFEKIFGNKYGGEAIMVNSGSSADLLISFGISEKSGGSLPLGSEILVPSVTWPTHLWSLVMAGFKVKLIDVDPSTLNFDLGNIERNISNDTRGIFIVHLLGNMGDMKGLTKLCREKNLVLMEDCCEALGSKFDGKFAGTFGIASSFSFFFSHHLVTMEGGMILTKDKDFAKRCRLLRSHGWDRELSDPVVSADSDIDSRYKFVAWGFNLRPTELQAGFGIEQIKKIDKFQVFRDQNAAVLEGCINRNSKFLSTMQISNDVRCSWFAFPIIVNEKAPFSRKQLANFLDQNGIESRPIVAGNLAKQPATKQFPEITFGALPGANHIHQHGLYIGIHPTTNINNLKKVVQLLNNYCDQW